MDLPLDNKTVWASGPPGRRAVGRGPLGLRAAGPLGRGGPWAAGRWAAGLLLAKPFDHLRYNYLTLALSQKLHVNLLDPYSFIAHSLATQEFPVIVDFIYWFSLHSCQMATSYLSRNMITTRFRHPYRPIGRIFLGR